MKYQPLNSTEFPRFSGIKTFIRLPHITETKDIDFAVTGIPYDTCVSYRTGARLAPSSIREISSLCGKPYNPAYDIDIFKYCSGIDYGDIKTVPGYIEESFEAITNGMIPLFKNGITPIAMGGDHSITLPELRACSKTYGKVALLHFDAHYDTLKSYFGKPYNHGTPFYYAAKEGLIDPNRSIQIGIRGELYDKDDDKISPGLGFKVMRAGECHKIGMHAVIEAIKERIGNEKVFLTFDIDCLDPSCSPGTGTPAVGGFSTVQALELIRGVKDLNIIGYDVVEVNPQFDVGNITSLAAATFMYEFISQIAYRKKKNINCAQAKRRGME